MIEANSAPEQVPGTIFSHALSNNPAAHSLAPVLSARALRRAYGSTLALDGVDLEIRTGEREIWPRRVISLIHRCWFNALVAL